MPSFHKVLAVVLLLFAAAPLWAQTNAVPVTNAVSTAKLPAVSSATNNASESDAAESVQSPNASANKTSEAVSAMLDHSNPVIEDVDVTAIAGILSGCIIPVSIVGLCLYFAHRRTRVMHETFRVFVEKGVPIPPELLGTKAAQSANRPMNDLRVGLILSGVGLGVIMLAGAPGFIVLFIGGAFLVLAAIGRFAQSREKKANDSEPANK